MKRFVFRLERVRRLRELAKREAEARLARAHAAANQLREEIEGLEARAECEGRELAVGIERGTPVAGGDVRRAGERIATLHDIVRRRRSALAVVLEEVSRRELEFIERKRAHEVLEKLRTRKRRDWIAEVERDEQRQLDESHRSRLHANQEETRLS